MIPRAITQAAIIFLSIGVLLAPVSAQQPPTNNLCQSSFGGYVIGYFNGVWTTQLQAEKDRDSLKAKLFGPTYNGEPLQYELFYNQTGIKLGLIGTIAGGYEDLGETFQERSRELDGALAGRWEIFWETLGSSADKASFLERLTTKIGNLSPELSGLLASFADDIITRTTAGLLSLRTNPPTNVDYTLHDTRITALITERKKLLLFAHSQGNLFVSHAYDKALSLTDTDSVKVVHIAPASIISERDVYELANLDLVINGGLRGFSGLRSVPPYTVSFPISHLVLFPADPSVAPADPSGHRLFETYLNPNLETLTNDRTTGARDLVQAALDKLVTPRAIQGNVGFFTVTLAWNGSGDVDLHVTEPTATHVFYSNKQGNSGFLDVDNVVANGPEHYFATCDATRLAPGTYQIGINNFRSATGRTATIQVATVVEGEIFTKSLDVGPERGTSGDNSPIPVVKVIVSKDAQGNFKAETLQ